MKETSNLFPNITVIITHFINPVLDSLCPFVSDLFHHKMVSLVELDHSAVPLIHDLCKMARGVLSTRVSCVQQHNNWLETRYHHRLSVDMGYRLSKCTFLIRRMLYIGTIQWGEIFLECIRIIYFHPFSG